MKITSILPLFPEMVSVYEINADNKKVLKFLKGFKWAFRLSAGGDSKAAGGDSKAYSSTNFILLEKYPFLKKKLEPCIQHHIQNILKQQTNYRITTSWATRIDPTGYAKIHYHSNAWLSGVYYPEGHENFKIRFHSPRQSQWFDPPVEWNPYNSTTWTLSIKTNTVVIFPSLLNHELLPNESNKTRYSIAFNIFPKGHIGGTASDGEVTL